MIPPSRTPSKISAAKTQSATSVAIQLAGLGAELAGPVLIGAYLSHTFGWGITPVLIGLLAGILAMVAHVLVFLRQHPDMHGKTPSGADSTQDPSR